MQKDTPIKPLPSSVEEKITHVNSSPKALHINEDDLTPESFFCVITQEIMIDPVTDK